MPNEVKQLEGGKLEVKLETGETFTGDVLEVTNKMAEAHVNTKRWGQDFKQKYETAIATPPAPPAPATPPPNPEEAQLQNYLMNQVASGLGLKDGTELKTTLSSMANVTEKLRQQAMAAEFMQMAPDFPNSPEAIDALGKKIDELGWDFSVPNMLAAHTLCARDSVYKPLTAEEQNAQWTAGLRASNKVPPPPPPPGSAPGSAGTPQTEWTMPLDQLRKDILTGAAK